MDFKIIYIEKVTNRAEARKREKYLKSGVGREFRNKLFESDSRV